MKRTKFYLLGGDQRAILLAEQLIRDGHEVTAAGIDEAYLPEGVKVRKEYDPAFSGYDVLVGPIPLTRDNIHLNCSKSSLKIPLKDLILLPDKINILGSVPKSFREERPGLVIDMMERKDMAVLNAIPTAEGAVRTLMDQRDEILFGKRVLVIGFGKVGKVLCRLLRGLGMEVYVTVRKSGDEAEAASLLYHPVRISSLWEYAGRMDVIFNTAPHMVLTEEILRLLSKDTVILDLASKPGGADFLLG